MKLFLLGLMGSGKSYWADKIGGLYNIPAFHLDDEIEISENKKIADIFTVNGERYFREKESEILKCFSNKKDHFILSTGGGTPCFFDNMDWMNNNGITIWIDEPVEIISSRLIGEKLHRPLIKNIRDEDLSGFFWDMREKRKPFYSKANYCLTNNITELDFFKIISGNE